MSRPLRRREFLARTGAALLGGVLAGCSFGGPGRRVAAARVLSLLPPRASTDRITGITVCTRPFRARGPRLEVEQVLGKTVVHNYGHGGSGWSLSWGSSAMAAELALAGGERQVAVIGCGAIGLTSALLLQRAGARVTIYAKELPPNVCFRAHRLQSIPITSLTLLGFCGRRRCPGRSVRRWTRGCVLSPACSKGRRWRRCAASSISLARRATSFISDTRIWAFRA